MEFALGLATLFVKINQKETTMRAILLAILMAVSLLARADYIDLEGADVLHAGRCVDNGKQFMCALLDFKGNNYFVLVD